MQERTYDIRISPEVIKNKIFPIIWSGGGYAITVSGDPCCIEPPPITGVTTGLTYVYSSMTQLLSGGTNGVSLLDITIPIFLSENTVDIGYYNVFDGFVLQQDTMLNFLFEGDPMNTNICYFYNTSDVDFKKYLAFSNYQLDWGDGSPIETITSTAPTPYSHTYISNGEYTITMSGLSPWGYNIIKKDIYIPLNNITIDNPNGEAFFIPAGGNWSATPISYNYIYHYDEVCTDNIPCCDFTPIPFIITGYSKSSLSDIQVYGKDMYVIGKQVTGSTGVVGQFNGVSDDGLYTSYTINNINYYDYSDGTTVFVVESSGCTTEMLVCSAITKNEALMNVISEAEVFSNVFVERGKNSGLESIERLGEVDNVGDLEKYGYEFFTVTKI